MDARWWRGSIVCQKSKVERVYKHNLGTIQILKRLVEEMFQPMCMYYWPRDSVIQTAYCCRTFIAWTGVNKFFIIERTKFQLSGIKSKVPLTSFRPKKTLRRTKATVLALLLNTTNPFQLCWKNVNKINIGKLQSSEWLASIQLLLHCPWQLLRGIMGLKVEVLSQKPTQHLVGRPGDMFNLPYLFVILGKSSHFL